MFAIDDDEDELIMSMFDVVGAVLSMIVVTVVVSVSMMEYGSKRTCVVFLFVLSAEWLVLAVVVVVQCVVGVGVGIGQAEGFAYKYHGSPPVKGTIQE